MTTELSVGNVLQRLAVKAAVEFGAGSVSLLIVSLAFDLEFAPPKGVFSILLAPIIFLLFASAATMYLPFSICLGLVLNLFESLRKSKVKYSAYYAFFSIMYILIGQLISGWAAMAVAIGMCLIIGNLLYMLLYLKWSKP